MSQRFRDLLIIRPQGRLVIACDSIGGIGSKSGDTVYADPITVATFALRVPLIELLCAKADPIAVCNCLAVEYDPLGRQIIDQVISVAAQAGIPADQVTGSTEDNVTTISTGLGISAIGSLADDQPLPRAHSGDIVICIGRPISAPDDEVYISHPSMVEIGEVKVLVDSGIVHDALPIGSHGIAYEIEQMASSAGLSYSLRHSDLDYHHSAGPSSAILIACSPRDETTLHSLVHPDRPWTIVADIH